MVLDDAGSKWERTAVPGRIVVMGRRRGAKNISMRELQAEIESHI